MAQPSTLLLLGAAAVLTACAATPLPPLSPTHPGSPQAPEAKVHPMSVNLKTDDATRATEQLLSTEGESDSVGMSNMPTMSH